MSDTEEKKPLGQSIVVGVAGILSAIYLLNPSFGLIELIPDNLPIFGNIDEAAATALLISCLAYFGLDVTKLFTGGKKSSSEKPVNGNVVDE